MILSCVFCHSWRRHRRDELEKIYYSGSVFMSRTPGTLRNRSASGLNSGVSTNCLKRDVRRRRRLTMDSTDLPLFNKSASRSQSSTMSRVRAQGNSSQVHLTFVKTSSLSSMSPMSSDSPPYKSLSSCALTVNCVWTSRTPPYLSSHFLGWPQGHDLFYFLLAACFHRSSAQPIYSSQGPSLLVQYICPLFFGPALLRDNS